MNRIDLSGRTAVITGGAQGIGYAIAERYLASGATVVLWDADRGRLEQAVATLSTTGTARGVVVELTDDASVQAAAAREPRIDILVNNAGITGGNGPTWELDPAVWRRVVDVNLIAPYLTCRAVVPKMIASGWGRIVNIASVAGMGVASLHSPGYSATKAAVISLTKTTAVDVAGANIQVNAIACGGVLTPPFEAYLAGATPEQRASLYQMVPAGRLGRPEEYASLAVYLAAGEHYLVGQVISPNGGLVV